MGFLTGWAGLIVFAVALPAWSASQLVEDFEAAEIGFYQDSPEETNFFEISADTPGGGSGKSLMVTITDWYQWEAPEDSTAEFYMGIRFAPFQDYSGWTYVNFYIKGAPTFADNGAWLSTITNGDTQGNVYSVDYGGPEGSESAIPCEWTYVSVPITDPVVDFGTGFHDNTKVRKLEFGFTARDVGPQTVLIDHITLSDTPEEGMLPGAVAPGGGPCEGSEGEGEGEGEAPQITLTPDSSFPILGQPYAIGLNLPFEPDFYSTYWSKTGETLNEYGAPCIEVDPPGAGVGDEVTVTLRDYLGNLVPVNEGEGVFYTDLNWENFGGPGAVTYTPDGRATFTLTASLFNLGYLVVPEGQYFHYYSRIATGDFAAGTNCSTAKSSPKAVSLDVDPQSLYLVFDPLELSDAGEYCVYISGETGGNFFDQFVCFTLSAGSILPTGSNIPAAGFAGIGLLTLSAAGVGCVYLTRRRAADV